MLERDEILEYPYEGTIMRVIQGAGDDDDSNVTLYEGMMDEHMMTAEEGRTLQTSNYIISIPLTKDEQGSYIVPRKGDKISLTRYGEQIEFDVENAEPSQLGGVSIYASRNSWNSVTPTPEPEPTPSDNDEDDEDEEVNG